MSRVSNVKFVHRDARPCVDVARIALLAREVGLRLIVSRTSILFGAAFGAFVFLRLISSVLPAWKRTYLITVKQMLAMV